MACRHYGLPGADGGSCRYCGTKPGPATGGGSPPTAEYYAAKAQLRACRATGEADPARLHGPDLARHQLREARAARGEDLDGWMTAVRSRRPGADGSTPPTPASRSTIPR